MNSKEAAGIFPVSREAVVLALGVIGQNPDAALNEESEILSTTAPHLNRLVHSLKASWLPINAGRFVEGALWGHCILRKQSEIVGQESPNVTYDVGLLYIRDRSLDVEAVDKKMTDPIAVVDYYSMLADDLAKKDAEYGSAMREITKYRLEGTMVTGGMVEVYLALQKADRVNQMSKWQVTGE